MPRMQGVDDHAGQDDIKTAGKIVELVKRNAADLLADPRNIQASAVRSYDINADSETIRVTLIYAVKYP